MKLKQITFYFENCDWITIDGKYVGCFLVDELHTYFKRTARNAIEKVDAANVFAIEIHKDANKERYQFEQNQDDDFKQMTFDRFSKHRDISSIGFELEVPIDEETCKLERYDYYLNWVGDSDYENEAQTNYISKDGHLYIVVATDKDIEDFFDWDKIDDSEYMDFHFDMCDVGDKYGDPDRYNDEEDDNVELIKQK